MSQSTDEMQVDLPAFELNRTYYLFLPIIFGFFSINNTRIHCCRVMMALRHLVSELARPELRRVGDSVGAAGLGNWGVTPLLQVTSSKLVDIQDHDYGADALYPLRSCSFSSDGRPTNWSIA